VIKLFRAFNSDYKRIDIQFSSSHRSSDFMGTVTFEKETVKRLIDPIYQGWASERCLLDRILGMWQTPSWAGVNRFVTLAGLNGASCADIWSVFTSNLLTNLALFWDQPSILITYPCTNFRHEE
jgi:hypothetical protein